MAMKRSLRMSVVITVIACGVLYGQRALVSAAPAGEAAAIQAAPEEVDLSADQRMVLEGPCPDCTTPPCQPFPGPIVVTNGNSLPDCSIFDPTNLATHPCTDELRLCNSDFGEFGNGLIVNTSNVTIDGAIFPGGPKKLLCGQGNEGNGITICRGVTDVTIKNFRICGFAYGIAVAGPIGGSPPPTGIVLENNEIVNCKAGIFMNGCGAVGPDGAEIRSNTITDCFPQGIRLQGGVTNTKVMGNRITNSFVGIRTDTVVGGHYFENEIRNNLGTGLHFRQAADHRVYDNLICDNFDGIFFGGCVGGGLPNTIYNNIFNNFGTNAEDFMCTQIVNEWNVPVTQALGPNILGGPCQGGNVWSDYSETCQPISLPDCPADTFCEPRVIDGTARRQDEFPLKLVDDLECVFPVSLVPHLDIKPESCPNPLKRTAKGYLPVALAGSAAFDPSEVDLSSLQLSRADGVGGSVGPNEGRPGPHSVFEDVASPFEGELCGCHELGGDGFSDLSMKFKKRDLVDALELDDLAGGTVLELVLSGSLLDGTSFTASDCIVIL